MRRFTATAAAIALAATATALGGAGTITVGAVYPVDGPQGKGGLEEYRGAALAAEHVNARGGVGGRAIRMHLEPVPTADHAPDAVGRLAAAGVPVVLGSHGSTMSAAAAETAETGGVVFWETGAVGELGMRAGAGERVFRFSPTGESLGRASVRFAREQLLPRLGRDAASLRWAVVFVDDAYGRAVGGGALAEIRDAGLPLAGALRYSADTLDARAIVRRLEAVKADVLVVASYLEDGVALRRETLRKHLPLLASVGTSSSYCMPEFGELLGAGAVGLFASDKPDGHAIDPARLAPDAGEALRWARDTYRARFGEDMDAHALSGFTGAWALFRHVLPAAGALTPDAIARAARAVRVPEGGLPNGSGLAFGAPGRPGSTDNLRATSVIWEWVAPRERAVVWPPAFATADLVPIGI